MTSAIPTDIKAKRDPYTSNLHSERVLQTCCPPVQHVSRIYQHISAHKRPIHTSKLSIHTVFAYANVSYFSACNCLGCEIICTLFEATIYHTSKHVHKVCHLMSSHQPLNDASMTAILLAFARPWH